MHIVANDYQVIFLLFLERLKGDVKEVADNFGKCEISGVNKIVIDFTDVRLKIRIADSNRLIIEADDEEVQEHYLSLCNEVDFFMNYFTCWVYAGFEKVLIKLDNH